MLTGWNLPLMSYKMRKFSPVFGIETTSIVPRGNLGSRRTLLSILILPDLSLQILVTSWPERAYFSLLRSNTDIGMHSLSLWGPVDDDAAEEHVDRVVALMREASEEAAGQRS